MKKLYKIFSLGLLSFLIVHCILNINNCSAQWVSIANEMGTSQSVWSLAISGNTIFAGTGLYPTVTGVYKSTNNGNNWTQTALNNLEVDALSASGNYIFAGTSGSGVYVSTNNGTNWTQTAMNSKSINSLATLGNNVFAGTVYFGIYLSTDNGTSWAQTSLNTQFIHTFAIIGNNIFAGAHDGSVYLSTNNGTNWSQFVVNNEGIICLAVLGNNIFAGTNGNGIYLSTNNGTNWTQTALSGKGVYSFAVLGNNIFAGTISSGVYLSTDSGTNWTQKNEGFTSLSVIYSLLITNNYIFAGGYQFSAWRRPLSELIVGVKNISSDIPSGFLLSQNYPNPFNPTTRIKFSIPPFEGGQRGMTSLKVYDILGKEIETLVNEKLNPGKYKVTFNASQYPSGVYFYRLITESFSETKRMILLK